MKLYTQISISLLCLISLLSGQVVGQDNYVLLSDVSGIERIDYETEMDPIIVLQDDVNELAGSVFLDFKFYDVGFYLHSSVYEEEIDEYMNRIISDEIPTGAQYLIFARISDKNGIYSRLKFYSNLPENPANCFSNDNFQVSIQDYIDYYSIGSVSDMLELQSRVIPVIINQLKIQYVCCVPIGELVDDLIASKTAAVGNQAGNILDVTGDLVEFMNLTPGGVKAWEPPSQHKYSIHSLTSKIA